MISDHDKNCLKQQYEILFKLQYPNHDVPDFEIDNEGRCFHMANVLFGECKNFIIKGKDVADVE